MAVATITVDQFRSICRACLCDCKNVIWFNIQGTLISENIVADVISKYASIQVTKEDDALPKQLCQQCLQDLVNCHEFIQKYQETDQTLLSILNKEIAPIKVEQLESQLHDIKQEEIDLSDLEMDFADKPVSSFQKHTSDANDRQCDFYIDDKKCSIAERQVRANIMLCRCKRCGQTSHKLSSLQFHCCLNKRKNRARYDKRTKSFNKGSMLKVKVIKRHLYEKTCKLHFYFQKRSFARRFGIQEKVTGHLSVHERTPFNKRNKLKVKIIKKQAHEKMVWKRHRLDKPYERGLFVKGFISKGHPTVHKETPMAKHADVHQKGFRGKAQQTIRQTNYPEKKPYKCGYCEKYFTFKAQRVVHERTHTGEKLFKCGLCCKAFTRRNGLKAHQRIHTGEKPYKCGYCEKSFKDRKQQVEHERIHTGEKPYKCGYCDKSFRTSGYQVFHERTHTGEKPNKCSYCNKSFIRVAQRTFHERTHTGEKPFKCSFCSKAFTRSQGLKMHERTHTGEKPYKCEYCEKSFKDRKQQVEHERQHTGEKPYKCGYCEKSFAYTGQHVLHERTHTGEKASKCSFCDKSFIRGMQRIIHERTHTGERPYKCGYCEKRFAARRQLVTHEKSHTGEKPYKCGFCDKGFHQKGDLTNHERTCAEQKL